MMIKNRVKNEEGMILAMVLMLMAIIAILGVMAINTSTIDIQIFGNQKRSAESLEVAQGGVDVSIPIIENILINGASPDFSDLPEIVLDGNVDNEILGDPDVPAEGDAQLNDVTVTMAGGATARVDIDNLYSQPLAGGSLEFAGGYEGVGASAAGGGTAILFRVKSEGFR